MAADAASSPAPFDRSANEDGWRASPVVPRIVVPQRELTGHSRGIPHIRAGRPKFVGRRGLEPLTPCASCKCATSCANGPTLVEATSPSERCAPYAVAAERAILITRAVPLLGVLLLSPGSVPASPGTASWRWKDLTSPPPAPEDPALHALLHRSGIEAAISAIRLARVMVRRSGATRMTPVVRRTLGLSLLQDSNVGEPTLIPLCLPDFASEQFSMAMHRSAMPVAYTSS